MTLDWSCQHHDALTKEALYAILALRTQVFVVEQKCPYLEVDGLDLVGDTHHLMARDGERLVAYLRLLDPVRQGGEVVIGRVVIEASARGAGLGRPLMVQALEACERLWPGMPVYLSVQAHLQGYYGRFGFEPVTEVYLEDDIPHIGMRKAAGAGMTETV
ncbi:ElaA protein [Pseudomonas sp. FeS53a]|uniref:GNAT family N-acetyltransferase n=1 Tax=Pseudomonas sp. FeS53a TaxID=1604022 RepID=UPI0005C86911|nr:GNAT family N-acetyltransferase [Pseudomonas sp. FeS53a]KIV65683.1 ElaA protein [Pseudomonas sp. FeS53a]